MKLLKQCIACLSDTRDSAKQKVLLNLSDQCCTALLVVDEVSKSDRPELTFSKLLLHLARVCVSIGETSLGVSYCSILHSQLTKPNIAEASMLLKQSFELQWRAAIEQGKKGCSKEDCLELRRKALQSLLHCHDCDVVYALQGVMNAECCFTGTTSLATTSPHHLHLLQTFHSTLIPYPADMLHCRAPCNQFIPVARYLLHRVVLATRDGQEAQGKELMKLSEAMIKKHQQVCNCPQHWPVSVQGKVVRLWKSVTASPTQRLSVT